VIVRLEHHLALGGDDQETANLGLPIVGQFGGGIGEILHLLVEPVILLVEGSRLRRLLVQFLDLATDGFDALLDLADACGGFLGQRRRRQGNPVEAEITCCLPARRAGDRPDRAETGFLRKAGRLGFELGRCELLQDLQIRPAILRGIGEQVALDAAASGGVRPLANKQRNGVVATRATVRNQATHVVGILTVVTRLLVDTQLDRVLVSGSVSLGHLK
jgi:hypothetical protein